MEDARDSQLLIQFMEGNLSASEQAELLARLEKETALQKELEQLQNLMYY